MEENNKAYPILSYPINCGWCSTNYAHYKPLSNTKQQNYFEFQTRKEYIPSELSYHMSKQNHILESLTKEQNKRNQCLQNFKRLS